MQQIKIDSNKLVKVIPISCYVCGREFGTKGFPFHYKECLIKFDNEQKMKGAKDRIKLPQAPEGLNHILVGQIEQIDLKNFNQKASGIFKMAVLPACKYCKRTFNAESLVVHMRGCAKKPSGYREKQNENVALPSKTPRALICCVCGQRFGTASLKIHYPECIKKFKNEEFRKHKKESDRRQPPQFSQEDVASLFKAEWTDDEFESFNTRSMENYRSHGMAECDNCGRKFFFEQIDKHRKNCELINGKLNRGKVKPEERTLKIAKPKSIVCIVCGRQYGPTSIVIHASQCEQLFKKQQALKALAERKKVPTLDEQTKCQYDMTTIQEWKRQKIDDYNRIVSDIYNKKSLSKCYICQRTFFEESLPKHLKDCELKIKDVKKLDKFKKHVGSNKDIFGQNFIDNVIEMNRQISTQQLKEVKKPKMLVCLLCGRQYGITSLKIHVPRCRGQNQEKKNEIKELLNDIKLKYNINQAQKWDSCQIEAYNSEVSELYKKRSLFQCKYCHRTFFQDSLKKHIKHCEKDHGQKKRGLQRSKTMGAISCPEQNTTIETEQLEDVSFAKKQTEKIIYEQEEDQLSNNSIQDNYHALDYGELMNQADQSREERQPMEIEPNCNENIVEKEDGKQNNGFQGIQVFEVGDL